jgi:hypothetical protein
LQFVKDQAQIWVDYVSLTLLAELSKHDPHLLDGLSTPGADIARENKGSRDRYDALVGWCL